MPAFFFCAAGGRTLVNRQSMRPDETGRNEPCPCGSGRKYKKCCGLSGASAPAPLPNVARTWAEEAHHHFQLGNVQYDRGLFAESAASQRRALALRPDFIEAHNALGLALQETGRLEEAAASYRCALELHPRYADALGNLGNVLQDFRRFEEAAASYRQLIDIEPDSAEAHNSLGNTLLALRRLEAAADSYRRAIALRPDSAGALGNLAGVLRELGQSEEAIALSRRALALQPEDPEACRTLGNALFDLGRFDAAAASYRQALTLQPAFSAGHAALAMLLRQVGLTDDAEASCRRALSLDPNSAETVALLGELHADRGRFSEAQKLFHDALTLDPDLAAPLASIARYRKMSRADGGWLNAALRLLDKKPALQQEINLRYAIGKYHDDTGEYAQAFASYRLANELTKRYQITHDPERAGRRVDQVAALYGREWLREVRDEGNPSVRPIFIVGMPRSGTSLAEQILASHPDVFGAGELRFWHEATARYEAAQRDGSTAGAIAGAAADYLRQLDARSTQAARIIDKMPANIMNLGLIHAALPNARIIHLRRNPIDTCLSLYFQIFSAAHTYAHDLHDLARHYTHQARMMQHWRSTLPSGVILDVPYEGLVEDPEGWTRRMLTLADLPWDDRCLEFDRTERVVTTASNWQVRQKITRSSIGRWHNYAAFVGPLMPLLQLDTP